MYPTYTVSQIFSLGIRRTIYRCTLMYVYRIIAPKYTSKQPPSFRTSLHIKDCQFRYWGQQNTLTTSSMPTKTFNMLCKPTNLQFLGPPISHLELQYVPSTTYTITQLNNTPTTASIATHTFSSYHQHHHWDLQYVPGTINTGCQTTSVSLRRPPPPLKHIVHDYDYQRYHSCLERPYTIAPALRPPGRLWDQTHTQFDK